MKILHICTDKNIGGAGIWILNLLKHLDKTRYESAVLLPRGAELVPRLKEAGIQAIEAPIAEKSLDIKGLATLRRCISTYAPDIVHTHGSLSGRIAARLSKKPVILTRHWVSLPDGAKKWGLGSKVVVRINEGLADIFIATARQAAENLEQSGIPAGKIRIVLNGAGALEKYPAEKIQAEREKLGARGFTMGMLARLEEVKGHIYMLKAAEILKAEGREFKVLFAGTGTEEAKLKEKTLTMGLADRVKFLGFCENPEQFLNCIDLQINASHTETTCLAILEGMSIGLPTVASNGGGNPDVIQDGESGLIFPVSDAPALANCIRRLMEDEALRETMGKRAGDVFQEKFTGEAFGARIEAIYQEIRPGAGKRG